MITTLEKFIEKNDGIYNGMRKGFHVFIKEYQRPNGKPLVSYQYFKETKCSICDLPYFKGKWSKGDSHVECSCKRVVKVRKQRTDGYFTKKDLITL